MAKVLLTGFTGYVGRRLLLILIAKQHQIVCLVLDARRFDFGDFYSEQLAQVEVIEGDLTDIKV